MKRTTTTALAPTKCGDAERSAQELLHEIFARGSSAQVEAITGTLGLYVELKRMEPDEKKVLGWLENPDIEEFLFRCLMRVVKPTSPMERLDLSPAAQEVLHDGLRRNLTSLAIAQLIRQRTGEEVSNRTVRRRVVEAVREQEQRAGIRERIEDFIDAMKAANWFPAEVVLSLVFGLMMAPPENRTRLAFQARAGHRSGRAAVPESEWDRHAWQIVRRLRAKMNRGEDLCLADAEELGAICKLQGAAKNEEGGGNG